jgi:pentatricopeptide repeat protein
VRAAGFAEAGNEKHLLEMFDKMVSQGIKVRYLVLFVMHKSEQRSGWVWCRWHAWSKMVWTKE